MIQTAIQLLHSDVADSRVFVSLDAYNCTLPEVIVMEICILIVNWL